MTSLLTQGGINADTAYVTSLVNAVVAILNVQNRLRRPCGGELGGSGEAMPWRPTFDGETCPKVGHPVTGAYKTRRGEGGWVIWSRESMRRMG